MTRMETVNTHKSPSIIFLSLHVFDLCFFCKNRKICNVFSLSGLWNFEFIYIEILAKLLYVMTCVLRSVEAIFNWLISVTNIIVGETNPNWNGKLCFLEEERETTSTRKFITDGWIYYSIYLIKKSLAEQSRYGWFLMAFFTTRFIRF